MLHKDSDCHLAFTYRSNIRTQRAELVIGKHLRPFHHLVYLHQTIEERGIQLPPFIQPIPEMVASFERDWDLITNGFNLVDPQDELALQQWLDIVASHPQNNFEQIQACHNLLAGK